MSRRKQANPKPAKRDCDLNELSSSVHLDTDLLYIEEHKEDHNEKVDYGIFTKKELEAGKILGTFKGQILSQDFEEASTDGKIYFKVSRDNGCDSVHVMLENDGHWLKLLRSVTNSTEANVCLRISGSDVICQVIREVSKGVELAVTCYVPDADKIVADGTFDHGESEEQILNCASEMLHDRVKSDSECESHERICQVDKRVSPPIEISRSSVSVEMQSKDKQTMYSPTRSEHMESSSRNKVDSVRLFNCPRCAYYCYKEESLVKHMETHDSRAPSSESFCGDCNIQFKSPKTYLVHKQIYCKARHEALQSSESNEPRSLLAETESNEDVFVVGNSSLNGILPVIQPQAFFAAISTNPLVLLPCSLMNSQGLLTQNGIISTGAPIVLPAGITGSAVIENNTISLHPLHQTEQHALESGKNTSNYVLQPLNKNIRLYPSVPDKNKTDSYEVLNLKKISNTERNVETPQNDGPLDLTIRKRKPPVMDNSNQPFSIKRKYSLTLPKSPALHLPRNHSSSPELSSMNTRNVASPPSYSNEMSNSSGYTTLVPIPSLQVNGVQSNSCDRSSPDPPVLIPNYENPSVSQNNSLPLNMPQQKLFKQGNNICEDCNIVFYKYDNYLAHKKHYCAFRRRHLADSAPSDHSSADDNSNHGVHESIPKKYSNSDDRPTECDSENSTSSRHPVVTTHKLHPAVFTCEACGVRFSTSDNLNAHQTYYCSRKFEKFKSSQTSRRNPRFSDGICDNCGEPSTAGHEDVCCPEEWKCNYCDTVCTSIKTARQHLLTHSEVRGFCCIVCGYRGNTLRGMRTHVYEHLNGNNSQIEDILESSVVVDTGATFSSCYRPNDLNDDEAVNSHEGRLVVDDGLRDEETSSSQLEKTLSQGYRKEIDVLTDNSSSDSCSSKTKATRELPERDFSNENTDKVANRVCDVVIKTEEDTAEIHPVRETSPLVKVKVDPDSQEDSIDVEKPQIGERNNRCAETSVICRTSVRSPDQTLCNKDDVKNTNCSPKNKNRNNSKPELKYCKSCDISFHHLSNYIAHKKFYCVSRVIGNFQQETAPVQ